jgi:hypothetical protein
MDHFKVVCNLYEDLEAKYNSAKTPEEQEEVVKTIKHFLKIWKKMEGKIVENCLKMGASCNGDLKMI